LVPLRSYPSESVPAQEPCRAAGLHRGTGRIWQADSEAGRESKGCDGGRTHRYDKKALQRCGILL
ncbi:hypothetical protein, partial [Eisenbergiella tayi]|uniref:hypothetical protein n=1 Tax=Eisenbergiella tayi TaxID=1432052 RepID=UPI002A839B45